MCEFSCFEKNHRVIETLINILSYGMMFSIDYNLFHRRFRHDLREKSTVHKLEKNAKNTLFTKKCGNS